MYAAYAGCTSGVRAGGVRAGGVRTGGVRAWPAIYYNLYNAICTICTCLYNLYICTCDPLLHFAESICSYDGQFRLNRWRLRRGVRVGGAMYRMLCIVKCFAAPIVMYRGLYIACGLRRFAL